MTAKLGDIMALNYGKSLTATARVQGNTPVYSSAGQTGWHNVSNVNVPSIIVGRKGTVGTLYYCPFPVYCIDTAYYITQADTSLALLVAFRLLKSLNLPEYNEDAAVPGLNRNTVYGIDVACPNESVLNKCNKHLTPIYRNLDSNISEIARLHELSKTLVSRLAVR
jgi:type I restriction enzyme S subunit